VGLTLTKWRQCIDDIVETAEQLAPSLKEFHYDFQAAEFSDAQGRPVTGAAMAANTPRDAGIGEKTARRVVLLRSLLSADSGQVSSERGGILERILRWGDTSTPRSLNAVFSRSPQKNDVPGDSAGGQQADYNTVAQLPLNEVRGINRVVYDISGKPPATIEWE
jgi:hypothetical protein